MKDNSVVVDETPIVEGYDVMGRMITVGSMGPEILGPGEYYVLGDNRPASSDSRA